MCFEQTRGARRFRSINAQDEQKTSSSDGHNEKVQNTNSGIDCQWRSAHRRGGTSVRSWFGSVRKPFNYSRKRLQSCRLASFAKTTDTLVSGSAVKSHDWPKMWRVLFAVPGLSTNSESVSSSTSPSQDSLRRETEIVAGDSMRLATSSSSDSVLERSDESASRKLVRSSKA